MIRNSIQLTCAAILALSATIASAQDNLRPSSQALPESAAVMIQMQEPAKVLDLLRQRTKMGQVMLTEARWSKIVNGIREMNPDEWQEMEAELGKVGLKVDDWQKLLHGNFGYAVLLEKWPGRDQPLAVGVAWFNPEGGAETAEKFIAALEKAHENEPGDSRRVDIDIAGRKVRHFAMPIRQQPMHHWEEWDDEVMIKDSIEMQAYGQGGAAGAITRVMQTLVGQVDDGERPIVDQSNVFVTRLGGRILVAHSFPASRFEGEMMIDEGKQVDADQISGVEPMTAAFGRFINAHTAPEGGAFAQRLADNQGIRQITPPGQPIFEAYGNLQALLKHIPEEQMAEAKPMLDALGINNLSWGATKLTLDGNNMRAGYFLAAPTPRTGLVKAILDQPKLPAKPGEWVPADVIGYGHLSFDLAKVYEWTRNFATQQFGMMAGQYVAQGDAAVQAITQTDIKGLLAALGHKHMFVSYPVLPINENMTEMEVQSATTRIGLVWDLQNPQAWDAMVKYISAMAMMAGPGEGFNPASEQGFSGLRMNVQGIQGGLLTGRGRLVAGFGKDVLSPLLNALANPPQGENALINSDLYRRSQAILDVKDGMAYQIVDSDRNVANSLRMFRSVMNRGIQEARGADVGVIQLIVDMMPTDEEVQGMFGVNVGYITVEDAGLVGHGAAELPAP